MFDLETRSVEANAVHLAVTEAGVGGRPLLLVHGFTGAKEDFGDHLDALADAGWWVVAVDNRGHGQSDKPDDEDAYSFEIFADDVIALVDVLGWDRFSLLGHSMGGMVVQVVATLIGDRIDRLILMDTSHGPLPLADDATVAAARHIIATRGMDGLADAIAAGGGPLETEAHRRAVAERPGLAEWLDRKLRTTSGAMYSSMLPRFGSGDDRLDSLRSLTMPTLVIVGDQDEPFLGSSRRMADALPNAELAVIPDAGHSPQIENPDAWWKALSTFLAADF